jgi:hypothetical protein
MYKNVVFFSLLLISFSSIHAQDSTGKKVEEIDPAKPTNFYTQVNVAAEYSFGKADELVGTRISGQYTFNPNNLVLFELPLLYNLDRKAGGLGDIRLRYFGIIKKDYSKTFPKVATVAPTLDVVLPTGSFKNGLGSSSLVLAPGIVWGYFFNAKTQVFPIISYQYISKPGSDLVPDALDYDKHGITFQAIANYSFTKKTFLQVTPIYAINDVSRGGDGFITEFKLSHLPTSKSKIQLFIRQEFTRKQTTINAGYTVYCNYSG